MTRQIAATPLRWRQTLIIRLVGPPGAAIASQGERRPGGYRYYQNGCYVEQPGGWVAVSPRYCQTVEYAPPPPRAYYAPPPRPRCTYSPTYDPRRGTFIGRDGYERPCP